MDQAGPEEFLCALVLPAFPEAVRGDGEDPVRDEAQVREGHGGQAEVREPDRAEGDEGERVP
mgnify:CR=1 FL=1